MVGAFKGMDYSGASEKTKKLIEDLGRIPVDLEERAGGEIVDNAQTDFADVMTGLATFIFKDIIPILPTTDKGTLVDQFNAAKESGAAIAGTPANMAMHLGGIMAPLAEGDYEESAKRLLARPFTTALMFEPFLRGAVKAGKRINPRIVERVSKVADDARKYAQEEAPFAEQRAAARRNVADPYAQSTRQASAQVERTMREARSAEARIPQTEFSPELAAKADQQIPRQKFEPGPKGEAIPTVPELQFKQSPLPPEVTNAIADRAMARLPKYGEGVIDQSVLRTEARNIVGRELLEIAKESEVALLKSPRFRTRVIDKVLEQNPSLERTFVRDALDQAAKQFPSVVPELPGVDMAGVLSAEAQAVRGTRGYKSMAKEAGERSQAALKDYVFNETTRKILSDDTALLPSEVGGTTNMQGFNFQQPQKIIRFQPDKPLTSRGRARLHKQLVDELASQGKADLAAQLKTYVRPAEILVKKGIVSRDALIHPGMNASLGSLLNVAESSKVFNMPILGVIKRALTSQNIKSALNNLRANYILSMLDDGLRADLIPDLFERFADPPTRRAFLEAIERTGLVDNNLLAVEAGGVSTTAIPALDFIWRGVDALTKNNPNIKAAQRNMARMAAEAPGEFAKLQDRFYNFGDQHFKVFKAMKEMADAMDDLGAGAIGDEFTIKVGRHNNLRLRKTGDKQFTLLNEQGVPSQALTDAQLLDIVAEASTRPALNLYVDYFERPLYLEKMANSRLLGVTSPFITWAWKTMDIPLPFIGKKGLLGHILAKEPPISSTNSPAVLARQAERHFNRGIRRAGALTTAHKDTEENMGDLKRAYTFDSKGTPAVALMTVYGEPNIAYYDDMTSLNPLSMTDTLARGLIQTVMAGANQLGKGPVNEVNTRINEALARNNGLTVEEAIEIGKEVASKPKGSIERQLFDLQIKGLAGKVASPLDFLKLAQFAGTPISDVLFGAQEAEKTGKTSNFYKKTGKMLGQITLGGTLNNILFEGTGMRPSAKAWAQTQFSPKALGATEQFIKGVMGIGYRAAFQYGKRGQFTYGNAQKFLENYKKALQQGISKDAYYRTQEPGLTEEEREAAVRHYAGLETLVQQAYAEQQARMVEAYKKLGWFKDYDKDKK